MPLYGRVYTNDLDAPVCLDEFSSEIEDLTINWALHGGFQSAEVVLNCSYTKAYLYYRRFMGKRAVIDDHVGDRPVGDGFITSARMRRSGVTFTINGFWSLLLLSRISQTGSLGLAPPYISLKCSIQMARTLGGFLGLHLHQTFPTILCTCIQTML